MLVSNLQKPPSNLDFDEWRSEEGVDLGNSRIRRYLYDLDVNFPILESLAWKWLELERRDRVRFSKRKVKGGHVLRQIREFNAPIREVKFAYRLLSRAIARKWPQYVDHLQLLHDIFKLFRIRPADKTSVRRLVLAVAERGAAKKFERQKVLKWMEPGNMVMLIRPVSPRHAGHGAFLTSAREGIAQILRTEKVSAQPSFVFCQNYEEWRESWIASLGAAKGPAIISLPTLSAVALLVEQVAADESTADLAAKFNRRKIQSPGPPSDQRLESIHEEMIALCDDFNKAYKRS